MAGALVVGVAGFSSLLLTTFGMWVTVSPDNNYSHKFFYHSRNLFSKISFWGEGGGVSAGVVSPAAWRQVF